MASWFSVLTRRKAERIIHRSLVPETVTSHNSSVCSHGQSSACDDGLLSGKMHDGHTDVITLIQVIAHRKQYIDHLVLYINLLMWLIQTPE